MSDWLRHHTARATTGFVSDSAIDVWYRTPNERKRHGVSLQIRIEFKQTKTKINNIGTMYTHEYTTIRAPGLVRNRVFYGALARAASSAAHKTTALSESPCAMVALDLLVGSRVFRRLPPCLLYNCRIVPWLREQCTYEKSFPVSEHNAPQDTRSSLFFETEDTRQHL